MLTRASRHHFRTVLDAITLTAPDDTAPAIIYLETGAAPVVVSRADFRASAHRYASALRGKGIRPRELVIIAHTQNLESIYAFWGALLIGAIPSMFPTLTEKLDPDIYRSSMALLAKHSQARAILTTDAFAPSIAGQVSCVVYGSSQLKAADNPGVAETQMHSSVPAPDRVAFLQHSSGTTGLQKGVALAHTAVLNQLASYSDALQITTRDVVVSWLPLYHDMGLIAGFLLPLIQGIPLVLMSPFDWVKHPAMLMRAIHDYHGTLCWLPNFAYNHCARRIRQRDIEGLSLVSMRAFINCSEPVHNASHALFRERFAANGATPDQLAVSYAMAENTFAVTQTPIGKTARLDIVDRAALEDERLASPVDPVAPTALANVSCGPAIEGVEIKVVDDGGRALPDRHVGEVAIKSHCMLAGYYNRPELNDTAFQQGWYLTGDMGYLADGEVYIVGRKKDLIISGGKNIYPQDLEAIVNTVPGVHPGRVAAFGVPDEREGTELIALVAEVHTVDLTERASIGRAIRQAIAQQATVAASYVHLVGPGWLIKTSSGKIARAANCDKWLVERNLSV